MIEGASNKMQGKDKTKEESILRDFNFPDYGIVIKAVDLPDAQAQLEEILANKK